MEEKRFDEWMKQKEHLHSTGGIPVIKEGEVWWCGIGENVGVEINGKNELFSRPVVIIKKLSRYGFLGVPLTSQNHSGSWYAPFEFKNKTQYAALAQVRVMSVSRLYKRMGTIPESDLDIIKTGLRELYFG